jgi:hypothetical protein
MKKALFCLMITINPEDPARRIIELPQVFCCCQKSVTTSPGVSEKMLDHQETMGFNMFQC